MLNIVNLLIFNVLTIFNIIYLLFNNIFCIFAEVDIIILKRYKMSKRGSRGKKCSLSILFTPIDEVRLSKTLSLEGVLGEKPTINGIMPLIEHRLDEERRKKLLDIGNRWKHGNWSNLMLYDCMGEDDYVIDYDDDDDLYDELYGSLSKKELKRLNKKLFKRNNKKKNHTKRYEPVDDYWSNRGSMFNNGEWSDEDDYESPYKSIKFYDDISNELSVREFDNLKEFNDFCLNNGYHISMQDRDNLMHWSVIHCCLDPISLEYGEKELITDNSYGGLYWTVNDDSMSYGSHYEGDASDDEVSIVGGTSLGARTFTS